MPYEIKMEETKDQPTLFVKKNVSVTELPKILGATFMAVINHIWELGEQPTGDAFVGYFNLDMDHLQLEIGFPVAKPLPGKGEIEAGTIPAGKQVTCLYKGPYMQMPAAYEEIQAWIASNGYTPIGPVYECYLNSPEEVPETELLTRIIFPVE